MSSRSSSTKRSSSGAEPIAPPLPDQRRLRPDRPVRSLEELVEFLDAVAAACGREERRRPPTTGTRFLL